MDTQTKTTDKQVKHATDTLRLYDLCKLLNDTQLAILHDYYGRPIPLDKTKQACNDIIGLIKTQNSKLEVLEEKIRTRRARYLKCFLIIVAITAASIYIGAFAYLDNPHAPLRKLISPDYLASVCLHESLKEIRQLEETIRLLEVKLEQATNNKTITN